MEENVIEDIGAAADELEEITERFIQSVGVSAVESRITWRGGRQFILFYWQARGQVPFQSQSQCQIPKREKGFGLWAVTQGSTPY